MLTSSQIMAALPSFRKWLSAVGVEVLGPTNEWELVRFKTSNRVSIIYRTKTGAVTMVGDAEAAWVAFGNGKAWKPEGINKTPRRKLTPMVRTLLERDGDRCFFCGEEMPEDNRTVEHLVALTHGGPNHISNLFLAHQGCNQQAGHLSAPEKIKLHVQVHVKTTAATLPCVSGPSQEGACDPAATLTNSDEFRLAVANAAAYHGDIDGDFEY